VLSVCRALPSLPRRDPADPTDNSVGQKTWAKFLQPKPVSRHKKCGLRKIRTNFASCGLESRADRDRFAPI
jgi:hypothetical protein